MYVIITDRYGLETLGGGLFGLGSVIWLGATDEAVEGNFLWLPSGNPLVFADWGLGQPNNLRHGMAGEDCAAYVHGVQKWHDIRCSAPAKVFICEG